MMFLCKAQKKSDGRMYAVKEIVFEDKESVSIEKVR
jgi:hypothetical protein